MTTISRVHPFYLHVLNHEQFSFDVTCVMPRHEIFSAAYDMLKSSLFCRTAIMCTAKLMTNVDAKICRRMLRLECVPSNPFSRHTNNSNTSHHIHRIPQQIPLTTFSSLPHSSTSRPFLRRKEPLPSGKELDLLGSEKLLTPPFAWGCTLPSSMCWVSQIKII